MHYWSNPYAKVANDVSSTHLCKKDWKLQLFLNKQLIALIEQKLQLYNITMHLYGRENAEEIHT